MQYFETKQDVFVKMPTVRYPRAKVRLHLNFPHWKHESKGKVNKHPVENSREKREWVSITEDTAL